METNRSEPEYHHHFEQLVKDGPLGACVFCGGHMPAKCTGPRQAPNHSNGGQDA